MSDIIMTFYRVTSGTSWIEDTNFSKATVDALCAMNVLDWSKDEYIPTKNNTGRILVRHYRRAAAHTH